MRGLLIIVSTILMIIGRVFYIKVNYNKMYRVKNLDYLMLAIMFDGFGLIMFVQELAEYAAKYIK